MRLKEDNSSWRSGGIKRRDFRHDAGLPETEIDRTKAKSKKARKRIGHKHVWVESADWYYPYWFETKPKEDPRPQRHTVYECSVSGCKARKYVANPRYGYDYWKWCKRQGRA